MADAEFVPPVYFAICNIPPVFRSADLRNYFSQFIESGGFKCCHFRHRPEVLKDTEKLPNEDSEATSSENPAPSERTPKDGELRRTVKSCCCVVSVHASHADTFMKMYSGNHWIDSKGNWLTKRCIIKRIRVSQDKGEESFPYKTKSEQRRHLSLSEHFTENDLKTLSELNPPALMPNGNVGTPVTVFLQLIQSCRLPPRLIRKLGLVFPKTSSNRRYGNVPFQYHNTCTLPATEETVLTATGHEISGPGTLAPSLSERKKPNDSTQTENTEEPETKEEDSQSDADDDDDFCEEWERHEALHEDVTSQERTKERVFEEEIELKWEKGGPGLVFYTDAQYWQEEEGDFDEQTADDWDVDMSVYYDKDGGDMDARDFIRMRYENRLRDGLADGSGQGQSIGKFEKFTKGFGRRVMEKQGWKDGEGLGSSQTGMPEALENEGQHPNCKRGFGYHGEKLLLHSTKKSKPDFHITTVYDKPKDMDGGDTLLRRQPSTSMKYRGWQPGGSIGPKR
ncbi:G patch domain-containing protein 3 [Periophthalmus magnuspinnatus]|uniref:G patch domain-containing protein 3 n=1 Tax=Periophthalmus magnuspinnatus TaxID=409849 RepID=UPI00145BE593|nr:G patch domain-containing protein 3 [Periophthalmus magnuspinnatus]